jgi:hypothetical protein
MAARTHTCRDAAVSSGYRMPRSPAMPQHGTFVLTTLSAHREATCGGGGEVERATWLLLWMAVIDGSSVKHIGARQLGVADNLTAELGRLSLGRLQASAA